MTGISKFGDVLVNFVVSAAMWRVTGIHDGIKVSNHILMQALLHSTIRSPPRTDKHQKGDYVEALIASAWNAPFSTDDMISLLASSLSGHDLSTREACIEAQIRAVSDLLDRIAESAEQESLVRR